LVTIPVTIPYQEPLYPLATCNPRPFLKPSCLNVLWNTESFQKAPLSVALPSPFHLERQASLGLVQTWFRSQDLTSDMWALQWFNHVQQLRRPLDILWLPWPYHSFNWKCLAQRLGHLPLGPLLKSSHRSPWELYTSLLFDWPCWPDQHAIPST
jgi:hypothetical protein